MDERQAILDEFEPLFKEAERKGLWFYYRHGDMWLSPTELSEHHNQGEYLWSRALWGAANWQLRNPQEKVAELKQRIEITRQEVRKLEAQIRGYEAYMAKRRESGEEAV